MGLSRSVISNVEHGTPTTTDTISRLAAAYDCTVEVVLLSSSTEPDRAALLGQLARVLPKLTDRDVAVLRALLDGLDQA